MGVYIVVFEGEGLKICTVVDTVGQNSRSVVQFSVLSSVYSTINTLV